MMLAEVSSTTIASVLESLGAVGTYLTDQVGTVFGVIQTYPIALVPIGLGIAFTTVKFAKYILGL